MADQKWYDEGTRPKVFINWKSFEDWGIPSDWKIPFQNAVINAYTRWMNMAGVDLRFQFWNYTERTSARNGELLIKMNERHANSTRLASTFGRYGKLEIVFHRKRGSDLTPWNFSIWYGNTNEFDMYTILVHEFGHCLGLDHSSDTDDVMTGGHRWHHRFGLYKKDVDDLQNVYSPYNKNRLRQLRSTNGGTSWSTVNNNLTNHNHNDARTNITPGVAATPNSGLYVLGYSSLNQKPIYLRGTGGHMMTNHWIVYGGQNSILGPAFASDQDANMLYAWVDNDDNGTIKLVRSTNHGFSWFWASTPANANTYGTPGLCHTKVGGQDTWILVWSQLDRSDRSKAGHIYASISTNDGSSWSTPVRLSSFYKVLSGVSVAADANNHIVVAFAWAPNSNSQKHKVNRIRTFNCSINSGQLRVDRTIMTNETTRIQPAVAYDSKFSKFIMAWRGQNFNTTLNVVSKGTTATSWSGKVHLSDKRSDVAPALAYSDENEELVLWYAFE
ncbi:matrixin family metalloprotease [Aquimarina sp. 2201CG5-10]|uniref:matrixin family metalloprotease n=1 Tax=Aquimarina callyspongiae TaxID=3098150 RepID=UPI002AB407CD|nr:matrixin family metalloprotease [Aquimarina sp. 2201CG5-10]MDY8136153.1 matrixin family metalloprotease [Aquimarina sp. 2201CG5-10]